MDRNNFIFNTILSWMYFHRKYVLECRHYVFLQCKLWIRWKYGGVCGGGDDDDDNDDDANDGQEEELSISENTYFVSVYKTPHLSLYSSNSAHCHTVISLFRLPHSMLKLLYRNLPAYHFTVKVEQ